MLIHPTLDQLHALGLQGMAKAFIEIDKHGDAATLDHAEWLALLLDRETAWRHDKRLGARLRYAQLRHQAAPEDVDYRSTRGLDLRLFDTLLKGEWIDAHDNLAICGPTGIGKSWLACAIGHRRAATTAPSSTPVSRVCSRISRSPAVMVVSPVGSRASPRSSCSFWMTGSG